MELKIFFVKFAGLIFLSPLMGFILLRLFKLAEKTWKTNDLRKQWLIMSGVFFVLACIGGWLR